MTVQSRVDLSLLSISKTRRQERPKITAWRSREGAEVLVVAQEEVAEVVAGEEGVQEGEEGAEVVVDMAVRG